MLKKLLDLFKKRTYITVRRRGVFTEDDRERVKKDIIRTREEINNIERRRMELKVFKEVLEDSNRQYSLNEINYLYNTIINENKVEH